MCARLFLGAFLGPESPAALKRAKEAVIDAAPQWADARWVPAANRHVTLAFFGDVPEARIGPLADALGVVAYEHRAFELGVIGVRARPSARRARLLWVELGDPTRACEELAADVSRVATMVLDVPAETRRFRAHVTLCRSRGQMPVPDAALTAATAALAASGLSRVSVPSVTLCESRLTPAGATYSPRATWPLARAGKAPTGEVDPPEVR